MSTHGFFSTRFSDLKGWQAGSHVWLIPKPSEGRDSPGWRPIVSHVHTHTHTPSFCFCFCGLFYNSNFKGWGKLLWVHLD